MSASPAAAAHDRDLSPSAVPLTATDGGGIGFADASDGYVDYSLTLPKGSSLEARADGSLDIVDAARISGFLGGDVWTLLGFGSCAELVMGLRR